VKDAAITRTRNQRVGTFDRDAVGMVSGAALALASILSLCILFENIFSLLGQRVSEKARFMFTKEEGPAWQVTDLT
jgi:hypothetical protein